ncbi:fimbrial protein [Stenotrophomonas sepilia]
MESVPYHHLGTIETWPVSDPSQRLRHPVSLGFKVPALTCALVQRDVTLAPASAERLQQPDDTAGDTPFDVMMACPTAKIDVTLSMSDANDPASTGSVLTPSTGSDAGGVRMQLLRGGQPMQLGKRWNYGYSSKGDQPLSFSARYLRVAEPLAPGVVKGEAVLTANYR